MFISQGLRFTIRVGGGWVGSRVGQFVKQARRGCVDYLRVVGLRIHQSAQLGHHARLGIVAAADGPDFFAFGVEPDLANRAGYLGSLDQDGRRRVFIDDDADQAFNYESTQSGGVLCFSLSMTAL